MIRWALKLAEFNIEWEHRIETQNAVADVLSSNADESIIGEKVNCAIVRDLVLSSREQLIDEQRKDPELGHIYRYLENPEDTSVNATISSLLGFGWKRVAHNSGPKEPKGHVKEKTWDPVTDEMRVYIPKSLRNEIMRKFNGSILAADIFEHLSDRFGKRHVKTVVVENLRQIEPNA
ncbi:hypothetical protein TNCV_1939581 [Trichonephila clavipes]|nr:hypothetical protein TNCV_1939581 [Trichonephila clavipes]